MSVQTAATRIATIRKRGFTLAELVMTLLIVSILAVFVVPRLDFKSTFDERAYHDKLKAGLQYARKAAVAMRRYVCVTVDATVPPVWVALSFDPNAPDPLTLPPTCNGGGGSSLALPTPDASCGGVSNRICRPAGVSLTAPASATSFWFDAGGRASAAVTFSSTGQPDINVASETGYVH